MDMLPNARKCHNWTPEEHANLTSAVVTFTKQCGKDQVGIDWVAVASLIPGRTRKQCCNKWYRPLVSNINVDIDIDPATGPRVGTWTVDENKKLQDGVGEHGAKNWKVIAALIPGRTIIQCCTRWHNSLVPLILIDPATARTCKWTADETLIATTHSTHSFSNQSYLDLARRLLTYGTTD
jgi:hypothetical protein